MSSQQKSLVEVSVIGIDIGKTTCHLIGQGKRGKIVMRAKVSRPQLMERLANVSIGAFRHERAHGGDDDQGGTGA